MPYSVYDYKIINNQCRSLIIQKRESVPAHTVFGRGQKPLLARMLSAAAAQKAAADWLFSIYTMLPKHDRLLVKDFDLVIRAGRETYSPFFSVKYIPAASLKFSPVAPKKIFKTAVSRNRVRRRIYAAVREVLSSKKIKPNHIVLVVKKDITDLTSKCLVCVLNDMFVQARLIA